ncbi:hypothetical protein F4774DRAFT_392764 [Daldinia eschscholtzii]|nr:hypothetical protein F4774DRAFT_392764 [Daldinia eschscholtzii]
MSRIPPRGARSPPYDEYYASDDVSAGFGTQRAARRSEYSYQEGLSEPSVYDTDYSSEYDVEEALPDYDDPEYIDSLENWIEPRMDFCCDDCLQDRCEIFREIIQGFEYTTDTLLELFEEWEESFAETIEDCHSLNRTVNKAVYDDHCEFPNDLFACISTNRTPDIVPYGENFNDRWPNTRPSVTGTTAHSQLQPQQQSHAAYEPEVPAVNAQQYQQPSAAYIAEAPAPIATMGRQIPPQAPPQPIPGRRQPAMEQPSLFAAPASVSPAPAAYTPSVQGQALPVIEVAGPAAEAGLTEKQPDPRGEHRFQSASSTTDSMTRVPTSEALPLGTPASLMQRQSAWEDTRGDDAVAFPGCEPYVIRLPTPNFDWDICFGTQEQVARTVGEIFFQVQPVIRSAERAPHGVEIVLGLYNEDDWEKSIPLYALNEVFDLMVTYTSNLVAEGVNTRFSYYLSDHYRLLDVDRKDVEAKLDRVQSYMDSYSKGSK